MKMRTLDNFLRMWVEPCLTLEWRTSGSMTPAKLNHYI